MPPRIAAEVSTTRSVTGSPSSSAPPKVASTGTYSCTTAAVVERSDGSTEYQIA